MNTDWANKMISSLGVRADAETALTVSVNKDRNAVTYLCPNISQIR